MASGTGKATSLQQMQNDQPVVFFDNPGGTQAPQMVIDAMTHYLLHDNANHGGAFATSQRSDAMLHEARQAMADMLGAASPDEIIFGQNMTTFSFLCSLTWRRLSVSYRAFNGNRFLELA
jgi:selenocysteine lyase/cysteine desulfurase